MSTLNTKAVIANLTMKMWQGTKVDRIISEEVRQSKKAKAGSLKAQKILMPDDPLLKKIRKVINACRTFHYANTLPWSTNGAQLLPSKNFIRHSEAIAKYIEEFDTLADQFCAAEYYKQAIERAKVELGDMFDPADYPAASEIRSHFFATLATDPIPDEGDFRINLSATEKQRLQAEWRKREKRLTKEATRHLYKRMEEMFDKAVDRLSDPDAKFHKTLTGNVANFAEILQDLNLEEDVFLQQIQSELEEFGKTNIQEVKEDQDKRAEKAEEAASLLERIKKQAAAFQDPTTV